MLNDWMPAVAALLALVECSVAVKTTARATAPIWTILKGPMMPSPMWFEVEFLRKVEDVVKTTVDVVSAETHIHKNLAE